MTATDELCYLLDERGVEWTYADGTVSFNDGKRWFHAWAYNDGVMCVSMGYLTPAQAVEATLGPKVTGETSDGYHTFNELYHHRAVLFSVIVRDHPELAWKSRLHHDGTMYDGMFIVGVETTQGQATYHYDVDPYWEMFDCRELDRAPEWDGHMPDDAIARIATLGRETCKDASDSAKHADVAFECSECGCWVAYDEYWETYIYVRSDGQAVHIIPHYCPNCGRRVVE